MPNRNFVRSEWNGLTLESELEQATELIERLGLEALVCFAIQGEQSAEGDPCWFRGHSCESWDLVPKAYRSVSVPGGNREVLSDEAAVRYEWSQYVDFKRQALSRLPASARLTDDNVYWLYLMQHYGLSTRLLDWSESVLIAAYFAVCNEERWDQDGMLYRLAPLRLNHYSCGAREHGHDSDSVTRKVLSMASGYDASLRSVPLPKGPISFRPTHIDQRMFVQHSAFTAHLPQYRSLSALPVRDRILTRFAIPAQLKPVLKGKLRSIGLTRPFVFPDLDSLGNHLSAGCYTG